MNIIGPVEDRLAVEELLSRYTWAIDDQNWDELDDLVSPDVVADYRDLAGPDALLEGADAAKAWLQETLGWRTNSLPWHYTSNHVIEVRGDRASSRHYMHNRHLTVLGNYYLECSRGAEGWRIDKLTLKAVIRREPLPNAPLGRPHEAATS